jgi:hypothetical protein
VNDTKAATAGQQVAVHPLGAMDGVDAGQAPQHVHRDHLESLQGVATYSRPRVRLIEAGKRGQEGQCRRHLYRQGSIEERGHHHRGRSHRQDVSQIQTVVVRQDLGQEEPRRQRPEDHQQGQQEQSGRTGRLLGLEQVEVARESGRAQEGGQDSSRHVVAAQAGTHQPGVAQVLHHGGRDDVTLRDDDLPVSADGLARHVPLLHVQAAGEHGEEDEDEGYRHHQAKHPGPQCRNPSIGQWHGKHRTRVPYTRLDHIRRG